MYLFFNGYADIENAFPLLYQSEGYNSTGSTTFEFSQKEYDGGIGLYYLGARYYKPRIGRWLAAGQGFSPYLYYGDNPMTFVGPE